MIKVRATQDGHYAGYYRQGPVDSDQGHQPGEVFEVDDTPHQVLDDHQRPILEVDGQGKPIPVLVNGKPKIDPVTGKPVFKVKMASFFSKAWMERVPDDTEITNDYEPFQVPIVYRKKKMKGASAPMVALPAVPVESPI